MKPLTQKPRNTPSPANAPPRDGPQSTHPTRKPAQRHRQTETQPATPTPHTDTQLQKGSRRGKSPHSPDTAHPLTSGHAQVRYRAAPPLLPLLLPWLPPPLLPLLLSRSEGRLFLREHPRNGIKGYLCRNGRATADTQTATHNEERRRGCPIEPGAAVEGRRSEPRVALEDRRIEPGIAEARVSGGGIMEGVEEELGEGGPAVVDVGAGSQAG